MTDPVSRQARQAAALARAVAVVDRLRSADGCPWYARQTHASLVPYALEEAHELAEAVDAGDVTGLREELGDVLLQVLVHARVAQDTGEGFDLADVADGLADKLVRRNPHVFGPHAEPGLDADAVEERWQRLKDAEKTARTSPLDGVPASLGALARAQKLVDRARRAGIDVPVTPPDAACVVRPDAAAAAPEGASLGERLLALVDEASRSGLDAEGELRRATARWERRVREPGDPPAEHLAT